MNSNIFIRYWRAYGGSKALVKSVYLWMAILLTALLYPQWSKPEWWNDVLSIMPSMLGFSLGGFAMWMAIGDDDFRRLISGEDEKGQPSPYMEVNSAFVHFIVLQLLSIIFALFAKAYFFTLPKDNFVIELIGYSQLDILILSGYCLSYFIFIYALLSALAATLALFRVSSWYDINQTQKMKDEKKDKEKISNS